MSDSENPEKKKGFFAKTFGFKSKAEKEDEKRAEAAALKAEQQAKVDRQMAERMAAINAAALKSAREMDAQAEAKISNEERERIETEERKAAEAQALKDVEAAKRLTLEKEEKAKALAEKLKAEKLEAERHETERLAQEKRDAEKRAEEDAAKLEKVRLEKIRLAAEKANAEEAAALKAKIAKEQKERDQLAAIEREKTARIEKETREKQALEDKRKADILAEQKRVDALKEEKQRADTKAVNLKATAPETTPAPSPSPAPEPIQADSEKPGFLQRMSVGLKKSTSRMSDNVSSIFNKRKLDAEALEELEDLLIASDLGVGPAMRVTQLLAKDKFDKQVTGMEIKIALADVISETLAPLEKPLILNDSKPQILLFVGVNGSGKTTTLGKLAARYTDQGKKVLLCAGDTFRAAAVEQLKVWGERSGAPVVSATLGADAASLVYDAIARAKDENFDILMIDTAGRLQNRTELMDELAKVVRVIKKQDETAPHHSLLVLDATVGQNALSQTDAFEKTAGVTGLIMTKLDGTAKGGVLVALADKFKLPIHAIGIGERLEDLENFSAPVFAAALSGIADEVIDQ